MKNIFSLLIVLALSTSAFAGNGVERGNVMIKGSSNVSLEIAKYLSKELTKCSESNSKNIFSIKNVIQRMQKIDQGIIDQYYRIDLIHQDHAGKNINELVVEVLDSDFHNWRNYEEKLSMEIINDQNKLCN